MDAPMVNPVSSNPYPKPTYLKSVILKYNIYLNCHARQSICLFPVKL